MREHRLAMVQLAIADNPSFELSRVELDRPGPHFTLDTIEAISEQYPEAAITPLIGGDSLRDLPSWHKPKELVYASHWVGVMRRPVEEPNLEKLEQELPGISSKIHYVDATLLEIASREIRSRIAQGLPLRYYVPLPWSATISSSTSSTGNPKSPTVNRNSRNAHAFIF